MWLLFINTRLVAEAVWVAGIIIEGAKILKRRCDEWTVHGCWDHQGWWQERGR